MAPVKGDMVSIRPTSGAGSQPRRGAPVKGDMASASIRPTSGAGAQPETLTGPISGRGPAVPGNGPQSTAPEADPGSTLLRGAALATILN